MNKFEPKTPYVAVLVLAQHPIYGGKAKWLLCGKVEYISETDTTVKFKVLGGIHGFRAGDDESFCYFSHGDECETTKDDFYHRVHVEQIGNDWDAPWPPF